ncbi:MAG TPA: hypothetical protein VF415_07235 [Rhodanobacter sp.]
MSRASRESIYAALFALLQQVPDLKTCSRRLVNAQDVQPESFPAAYQVQEKQTARYQGVMATRATLRCSWLFYVYSSDPDAALSPQLNAMVDAACALLAPTPPTSPNTLGGLVEYAAVSGDIEIFEGVLGDRAIAIVPIEIVLAGF